MKDISTIKINDIDYAVGLEWEEITKGSSHKNLEEKIRQKAKERNRELGCILKKEDGLIQIGFGKQNTKGLVSIAAIVSKEIKDALFVKKINNIDNWICYVDSKGLIIDRKEGVFSDNELLDIIDELQMISDLTVYCSEEDKNNLFREGFDNLNVLNISIEDIIERNKKTSDDTINLIVSKSNLKKNIITIGIISAILGGGYYFLFTDDQMYLDIVNQELSSPISQKEKQFNKTVKENQAKVEAVIARNAGKKMLLEKVETNIYSKEEIYKNIQKLYEVYPLYFFEWQLDNIQFVKSEDNKDIKFSVVYKRIEDSIGYYNEIKEKSLELANKSFKLYNVVAYPGDLANNIIIIDHYFKKPVEIKSGESEQEKIAKLEKEAKDAERQIKRIKDNISEIEYRISNETSFIDKKFGSAVEEAAEEIETNVTKAVKLYDNIIKKYKSQNQEEISIPDQYYSGKKSEFLNLAQQNSFYQWRDDKQPILLPPPPTDKAKQALYQPFVKVWKFNMNSQDYSTQGVPSISRAVDVLNRTDISIYNVNYKIENESWYIKGELYEKN